MTPNICIILVHSCEKQILHGGNKGHAWTGKNSRSKSRRSCLIHHRKFLRETDLYWMVTTTVT